MYQTFIKTFILDTLYPVTCVVCNKEGEFLCLFCRSTLTEIERQQCVVCHKPSPFGMTHPGCKTPQAPDGLISVFDYKDKKVSEAIIAGKYKFLSEIYTMFGTLTAHKLQKNFNFLLKTDAFLVPIPLAKHRKRWRGFNQAEILCQAISKQLGWPVINALERTKNTKTQKDLKREQRLTNVEGAFTAPPSLLLRRDALNASEGQRGGSHVDYVGIKNKTLILVDDVTTTGATLREAAKILKRHGSGPVWCLTIAKD